MIHTERALRFVCLFPPIGSRTDGFSFLLLFFYPRDVFTALDVYYITSSRVYPSDPSPYTAADTHIVYRTSNRPEVQWRTRKMGGGHWTRRGSAYFGTSVTVVFPMDPSSLEKYNSSGPRRGLITWTLLNFPLPLRNNVSTESKGEGRST